MYKQNHEKDVATMGEFIHFLLQNQSAMEEIEELEKYCLSKKEKILSHPEAKKNILEGYAALLVTLDESESQSKYSRERYF